MQNVKIGLKTCQVWKLFCIPMKMQSMKYNKVLGFSFEMWQSKACLKGKFRFVSEEVYFSISEGVFFYFSIFIFLKPQFLVEGMGWDGIRMGRNMLFYLLSYWLSFLIELPFEQRNHH